MGDLTSPRVMIAKAILFVTAGSIASAVLALRQETFRDAAMTVAVFVVGAWCFCRAYYFAFYVIERYCDRGYRYAGLVSAARWAMRRKKPHGEV